MPSQGEFVTMENSLLLKIVHYTSFARFEQANRNIFGNLQKKKKLINSSLIKIKQKHFLPCFTLSFGVLNLRLIFSVLDFDPRPKIQYSS